MSLTESINMYPLSKSKSINSDKKSRAEDELDDHLPQMEANADSEKLKKNHDHVEKTCIFCPDGKFLSYWELWITVILLVTSVIAPLNLAFSADNDQTDLLVNLVIDFFFLIDIFISFNTAFYN